jgi:hypothetical protein
MAKWVNDFAWSRRSLALAGECGPVCIAGIVRKTRIRRSGSG